MALQSVRMPNQIESKRAHPEIWVEKDELLAGENPKENFYIVHHVARDIKGIEKSRRIGANRTLERGVFKNQEAFRASPVLDTLSMALVTQILCVSPLSGFDRSWFAAVLGPSSEIKLGQPGVWAQSSRRNRDLTSAKSSQRTIFTSSDEGALQRVIYPSASIPFSKLFREYN